MRRRWRWDDRAGVLVEITGNAVVSPRGPSIISDTMGLTRHPATGEYLDSKSRFRQRTRDAGCIEVGNEAPQDRRRWEMPDVRADLARAYDQLTSR